MTAGGPKPEETGPVADVRDKFKDTGKPLTEIVTPPGEPADAERASWKPEKKTEIANEIK